MTCQTASGGVLSAWPTANKALRQTLFQNQKCILFSLRPIHIFGGVASGKTVEDSDPGEGVCSCARPAVSRPIPSVACATAPVTEAELISILLAMMVESPDSYPSAEVVLLLL